MKLILTLVLIVLLALVVVVLGWSMWMRSTPPLPAHGQDPKQAILELIKTEADKKLPCLVYHSDKLVVITISRLLAYGESFNCDGHAQTISYYLYKGYNITAVFELEVFMTR